MLNLTLWAFKCIAFGKMHSHIAHPIFLTFFSLVMDQGTVAAWLHPILCPATFHLLPGGFRVSPRLDKIIPPVNLGSTLDSRPSCTCSAKIPGDVEYVGDVDQHQKLKKTTFCPFC